MKCVLPGRSIKAFGKAIFCLAKLGDDLYIEAQNEGLALKTVNSARSAFACFLFHRSFFLSYSVGGVVSGGGGDSEREALKCKISNKSCVSVFRALSTLEKTVDHCRIKLDEEENKLIFVFHCRHGIVKTHNLGYQETDAVQAVFDKENCANHLLLQAKILSEVVSNFPNTLDEVTVSVEAAGLRLKNYVEEMEGEDSRVSQTEISLTPAEFDGYRIGVDVALTFCLKELRALIHFTDTFNHCLSVKFEAPGRPIIISIEDEEDYEVDMVLATLLDNSNPLSQRSTTTAPPSASITSTAVPSTSAAPEAAPPASTQRGGLPLIQRSATQRSATQRSATQRSGLTATQGRHHEEAITNRGSVTSTHPEGRQAGALGGAKRTNPASSHTSSNRVPPHRTADTGAPTAFPSGSQFRHTHSNAPVDSISIAEVAHIPLPPQDDLDFMETEGSSESQRAQREHRTSSRLGIGASHASSTAGPSHSFARQSHSLMVGPSHGLSVGASDRNNSTIQQSHRATTGTGHHDSLATGPGSAFEDNDDVMDALFGEDNLDEVALDGQMFGFGDTKEQERKNQQAQSSALRSQPPPQPDDHVQHSPPPQDSDWDQELEDVMKEATPMESSFLPGTPPSKKFKPLSVLFGMDMFGEKTDDSDILAPDSDSDS